MDALEAEVERLRVAIDAVVPADDFPSASQAGGLRFWSLITGSERPDWADRVIAVLDLLDRRSGGRFADLDVGARTVAPNARISPAKRASIHQLNLDTPH